MLCIKKVLNIPKAGFRCIQSTSANFEEKASYEKGKVKFRETVMVSSKMDRIFDRFHYHRWDLSWAAARDKANELLRTRVVRDHSYNPLRVKILGPDLAIAHFVTSRNGMVKFVGNDAIFRHENRHLLPSTKNESFFIEAVDTSGVGLIYEGLDHFQNLKYLKSVSFRGNLEFDNWFLDRVSNLMPHIEYLDLSSCKKVDHNGLSCLYRMKNLRCLNVEGISNSLEFQLTCLTIEAEKPELNVIGIVTKPKAKSAFDNK